MPEMWMVRAGGGAFLIEEFIKNGYVAIGWIEMHDLSKVKNKDAIEHFYDKCYPDDKPGERRSGVSQITKFVLDMKSGDWMVTYNPELRKYHIGTIKSDYYFSQDDPAKYHHQRKVEWMYAVDRDALAVATKNSLGAIMTLFSVPTHAQNDLLQVATGKTPDIKPETTTIEEEQDIKEIREDIKSRAFEFIKDKIQKLDWEEMQELIAGILQGMGYKARVSPPGPDRGADVIASPDGLGLEQPRIRAEVKHRSGTIGVSDLRSFIGGLRTSDRGLYISTGGFTREARYEAERSTVPVTLIDIDELAMLLIDNYDRLDSNTRSLIPLVKIYWPSE
jgi:restriction system protein